MPLAFAHRILRSRPAIVLDATAAYVAQDLARGVHARQAGDAAARMRAGAAQVQALHAPR